MNRSEDRAPRQELFEPRSLEWQENGELASTEMFELVKRLRAVAAVLARQPQLHAYCLSRRHRRHAAGRRRRALYTQQQRQWRQQRI